jgi:hypothetical protein
MARTALNPVTMNAAGVAETFATPDAAGSIIPGSGDHFIHVKNASGAPITVTVQCPNTVGPTGLAVGPQTITVPATTGDRVIGPFSPAVFTRGPALADPGTVYVDYSAITSVTVACVKIGS